MIKHVDNMIVYTDNTPGLHNECTVTESMVEYKTFTIMCFNSVTATIA